MENVVCPICSTVTSISFAPIESKQAFLPDSSNPNNAVFAKARVSAFLKLDYPEDISYGILKCQACGKHFLAKCNKYSAEWVAVYPIPHKPISEDILEPIKGEFEEANLCYTVGAYRACVSMCQRALESLCQNQSVSGLNQLKDAGLISPTLFNRATEIRLWAGIIKHKPLTESVSKEDAEQLLVYLEAILNAVYVEPKRFEVLKQKRKEIETKSPKE